MPGILDVRGQAKQGMGAGYAFIEQQQQHWRLETVETTERPHTYKHTYMHTCIHAWIHEYMKRTLFESTCIHTIANHILWGQTSMKLRKLQWLKDWAPMPKQLVQKPMQSFVCIKDAHGSNPKKKVSSPCKSTTGLWFIFCSTKMVVDGVQFFRLESRSFLMSLTTQTFSDNSSTKTSLSSRYPYHRQCENCGSGMNTNTLQLEKTTKALTVAHALLSHSGIGQDVSDCMVCNHFSLLAF